MIGQKPKKGIYFDEPRCKGPETYRTFYVALRNWGAKQIPKPRIYFDSQHNSTEHAR